MQYSESESRRFGLRIFRYSADRFDPAEIEASTVDSMADLVICRVPAVYLSRLSELSMPYVVADILVHYSTDDLAFPRVWDTDLQFDECQAGDVGELRKVVRQVFHDYTSHYSSNPILDKGLILEGQVEWAVSYVDGSDRTAFLVRKSNEVVGFFTHLYEPETTEIVFGGVLPAGRGQGVYRTAIRHGINTARERGHRAVHTSTQVHNTVVQRVWASEGFILQEPQVTFHINAMLAKDGV
jgi:ribosomal protein S18 acetylase RimI-like enzyme